MSAGKPLAMLAAICLTGAHLFGCAEWRTALASSDLVDLSPSRLFEPADTIINNHDDDDDGVGHRDWGPSRHPVGLASMSRGPMARGARLLGRQRWRSKSELLGGRRNSKRDGSWQASNASDELVFEWPRSRRWAEQVANRGDAPSGHKFVYLVSPMSQLTHPIEVDRLVQGYRSLLPLSGSYRTALQKVAPSGDSGGPQSGVPDYQVDEVCRTRRERVQLTRDETEPSSGRVLRRCRGQIELNTCAGTCPSGVQPSIKSPSGFVKRCACCNEAAFRRIQVRLSDCSPAAALEVGQDQQVGQANFMDVEVEEPIDCACRRCEGSI